MEPNAPNQDDTPIQDYDSDQDNQPMLDEPLKDDATPQTKARPKNDTYEKRFILCLVGIEKFYIEKDVIKFLRKHLEKSSTRPLPLTSVYKKRGNAYCFLNFRDEEQQKDFETLFHEELDPLIRAKMRLNPSKKNVDFKQFKKVVSADMMLQESNKRKEFAQAQITDEDILKEVQVDIRDKVTPYHHLDYAEQIKLKAAWLLGREVLSDFTYKLMSSMVHSKEFCPEWFRDMHLQLMQKPEDERYQPCCPLEKVIEADPDFREGYRNKVEFTIGRRFESVGKQGPVCVGFNLGNISKGILFVEIPDKIKVISQESIQVAKKMEVLVSESGIDPYDRTSNKGFWRILLWRESKKTNQCMVSIVVTD